jgi:two-component system LytT family response regulator
MKAIIIDDEELGRALIAKYLEDFPMIEVVAQCINGFEGLKAIEQHQPDLVFLDIQMPKLTGIEMLELIDHNRPQIIFTTAYDNFAIRAFEENAIDYLLKPFSKDRFAKAVQKCISNQSSSYTIKNELPVSEVLERIAIKQGTKIHIIPVDTINYIESNGDYVLIYTSEGRFIKEKTMKYYEQHLPKQSFVRIHRSYIANIHCIARIENFEKESHLAILKNEARLKVSAEGYKSLKQILG